MKQHLINFYLDYFNNYLTVHKLAEDYGITYTEANTLINAGRKYHHEQVDSKKLTNLKTSTNEPE